MDHKKCNKMSNLLVVIIILVSIIIGWYALYGKDNFVMYLIGGATLVGGPLCMIAYIIEVKRGIFKSEKEETEEPQ